MYNRDMKKTRPWPLILVPAACVPVYVVYFMEHPLRPRVITRGLQRTWNDAGPAAVIMDHAAAVLTAALIFAAAAGLGLAAQKALRSIFPDDASKGPAADWPLLFRVAHEDWP